MRSIRESPHSEWSNFRSETRLTPGIGQYWANVTDGYVSIPHVKAGVYRLTVYAEGVFGQHEQDDVEIKAGDGAGAPFLVDWQAESHGTSPSRSVLMCRDRIV